MGISQGKSGIWWAIHKVNPNTAAVVCAVPAANNIGIFCLVGQVLGSGAFGKVVNATAYGINNAGDSVQVAVKMLKGMINSGVFHKQWCILVPPKQKRRWKFPLYTDLQQLPLTNAWLQNNFRVRSKPCFSLERYCWSAFIPQHVAFCPTHYRRSALWGEVWSL